LIINNEGVCIIQDMKPQEIDELLSMLPLDSWLSLTIKKVGYEFMKNGNEMMVIKINN